jgi:starch synthase
LHAGKALCKQFVQQGLGLEVNVDKPLVACITRLVPQKGIHLIKSSVYQTVAAGGQFVLLGSGHADGDFRALAEHDFKDSKDARCAVCQVRGSGSVTVCVSWGLVLVLQSRLNQ